MLVRVCSVVVGRFKVAVESFVPCYAYPVEPIIDCHHYFSGPARLRRRGSKIHERGPGSTSHGHGGWELTPSSLRLAVVVVAQRESKDPTSGDLPAFAAFKSHHPTGLHADWMYGGDALIFYDATGSQPGTASRSSTASSAA